MWVVVFMAPIGGAVAFSKYMEYRDNKRMRNGYYDREKMMTKKCERPDPNTTQGGFFNRTLSSKVGNAEA